MTVIETYHCPACSWRGPNPPEPIKRDAAVGAPLCPRCGSACNTTPGARTASSGPGAVVPVVPVATPNEAAAWDAGFLRGVWTACTLVHDAIDGTEADVPVENPALAYILGLVRDLGERCGERPPVTPPALPNGLKELPASETILAVNPPEAGNGPIGAE